MLCLLFRLVLFLWCSRLLNAVKQINLVFYRVAALKMTRISRTYSDTMQREGVSAVSADVIFASSRFPNYKIGANNQIVEAKDDPKVISMKEVIARETAQLLEQQKRLSVRDLASKFERGLAAAAKLSEEVRVFQ